jgi:hypothetical protein
MILILKGPTKAGLELARFLRNVAIFQGRGALVLLRPKGEEHSLVTQIEKLLVGVKLSENADINRLKFKADPLILVVGENASLLKEVEVLLPGFTKKFGPEPINMDVGVKI